LVGRGATEGIPDTFSRLIMVDNSGDDANVIENSHFAVISA